MSFNPFYYGMGTHIDYSSKTKKRSDNGGSTKKTSVSSSGKYCPHCNEVVENGNPDRENIYDEGGKEIGRKHYSCPKVLKVLAAAQSESTGLREAANT